MDKDTVTALRQLVGSGPIALEEAEKRYAEAGMPEVTYYDTLADLCSDVDCGIIISPDGLTACARPDHSPTPTLPPPPPPPKGEGRPKGKELDELRSKFVSRINKNAINGNRAMITDNSAMEVVKIIGIADRLAAWEFNDIRAFVKWLMAPCDFKIVKVEKQGKKTERLSFKVDVSPLPPSPPPPSAGKALSRYMLTHFACFPDGLQKLSEEIAACAVPDDWFVIDDPADRPMRLIDFKLQLAFAMAVRLMKMEQPSALTLGIDWAKFDTGFLTGDGRHVVARFELNQEKSDKRLQNYVYTGIELK